MDAPLAALLGALFGAIAGLVGGFVTAKQQSKLEEQKSLRARQDEQDREVRLAVAELGRKMATATHSMNWFSWRAVQRPAQFTSADIDAHDQEMHTLLPEMASALLLVSALSETMYKQLKAVVQDVYDLDVELAAAASSFEDSPQPAIAKIGALKEQARHLNSDLPERVANIINHTSNSK